MPIKTPPKDLIEAWAANCKLHALKIAIRELKTVEAHHSVALAELNQEIARTLDARVKRLTGPSRERYQRELRQAPADGRSQAVRAIAEHLRNQLRELDRQRKIFGRDIENLISKDRLQALKDDERFLRQLSTLHGMKQCHEGLIKESREDKERHQKLADTDKSRCPKEPAPTHTVSGHFQRVSI